MTDPATAGYPDALVASLRHWCVERLHDRSAPLVLGLSGLQGSGKSTLAAQLVQALATDGIDALGLSLDDAYLTRAQRQRLARDVHPLLATRGVPGTHDLPLLHATLDALAHATSHAPVPVPRFDKGTDDRAPADTWPRITHPPRVIVLEGWCIGVPPQHPDALRTPINALERDEDPDDRWRAHVNTALAGEYAALWRRLDGLVVLQAPSFDVVRAWRDGQEQHLRDLGAAQAMPPQAVQRFVAHFERISRHALDTLPQRADVRIELDAQRQPHTIAPAPAPDTPSFPSTPESP